MRLLLVVGPYRLQELGRIDHANLLLRALKRSSHQIEALLAPENDPIVNSAHDRYGVRVIPLPPELAQPRSKIQAALMNAHVCQRLSNWLDILNQFTFDLGICFYGHWLPVELLNLPKHGFLNFHPAPLPELRGMEPDTFAILDGRTHTHGTVHIMSEQYDDGPIVKITRPLQLTACSTPLWVFRSLSHLGISAIRQAIDDIETGQVQYLAQNHQQATYATRQRARQESFLNFASDDVNMVNRRYRAFLGQNIGICLKANIDQCIYEVLDLEIWKGIFPGQIGKILGYYAGDGLFANAPIVKIVDGLVVLRIGRTFSSDDLEKDTSNNIHEITFSCKRERLTSLHSIKSSLLQNL